MSNKSKAEHRIGKFYLSEPGKYADYGICWYDNASRQTRRLPTRTADLEQAIEALTRHHIAHTQELKKDEPVADALLRYYEKYAKHLPSEDTARRAMLDANECWGAALVSEISSARQKELVVKLRERGVSEDTIVRWFGVIWAAFNYAIEHEHLHEDSVKPKISKRHWPPRTQMRKRRSASPSKRQLAVEEIAALFDATEGHENGFRYLVLALGTGGRPESLIDLTQAQLIGEAGVLDLNPPGRIQNKKYRPTIPMCPTLGFWLQRWTPLTPQGHYLGFKGERIATDNFFRTYIRKAKTPRCSPYTLRHTIFSWLALHKVDRWERKRFMGHKRPDGGSTDDYTHYDPTYLRSASDAIQKLFEAVAPLTRVNILGRVLDEQPAPMDDRQLGWLAAWMEVEAMRVIGVNNPTPIPDRSPVLSLVQSD